MHTRQNQKNLTSAQKKRFTTAVLELKRNGAYDALVRTHDKYFVPDRDRKLRVGHMSPSFFPWHRLYLLEFERKLQELDPAVSIPYWDWTTDTSPVSSLWADDFLGGTGRASDRKVMTGPFAYDKGNWTVTVGITESAFLTRNLGQAAEPDQAAHRGRTAVGDRRPGLRHLAVGLHRRPRAASATSWRAGPPPRASAGATTTRSTSGSAGT